MGRLRGLLRGIAYREAAGPAHVPRGLHRSIRGLGVTAMATAAIVRLEDGLPGGGTRVRVSDAGHPPPLALHRDGRLEQLTAERPEPMLGVDPGAGRSEHLTEVRPARHTDDVALVAVRLRRAG